MGNVNQLSPVDVTSTCCQKIGFQCQILGELAIDPDHFVESHLIDTGCFQMKGDLSLSTAEALVTGAVRVVV